MMKYLIARRIVQLGILALFSFKATDFILQG
ncbi:quinol dehydrogenase ferredoxin subunit NapH, partial [Campylobacter jejuni]|nr:quinol dehydrogenase ferredoxin subunit NapH [Campylobacter jejuni]